MEQKYLAHATLPGPHYRAWYGILRWFVLLLACLLPTSQTPLAYRSHRLGDDPDSVRLNPRQPGNSLPDWRRSNELDFVPVSIRRGLVNQSGSPQLSVLVGIAGQTRVWFFW